MSGILSEFMKDEIEEERRKAVLEVKKSMAVNLSAQGVDIEIISKAAEVSEDMVEEWLKDGQKGIRARMSTKASGPGYMTAMS